MNICAFANEIGNGGDVIVCEQTYSCMRGRKIMLLDLYEACQRHQKYYDLSQASSLEEKVELALDRLAQVDYQRSRGYRAHWTTFWSESEIVHPVYLPRLPDEGAVVLPGADCEIRQLAYQQEPELPGDKRFVIDKSLWDQLDDDNRASTVMHELIYREAKKFGHRNSRRVRYFNAHILSDTLPQSELEYRSFIKDLIGLSLGYFGPKKECDSTKKIEYYESGALKQCFYGPGELHSKFGKMEVITPGITNFREDGTIESTFTEGTIPVNQHGCRVEYSKVYRDSDPSAFFDENEQLVSAHITGTERRLTFCYPDGSSKTIQGSDASRVGESQTTQHTIFHKSGMPKKLSIKNTLDDGLRVGCNLHLRYSSKPGHGTWVEFYSNGYIWRTSPTQPVNKLCDQEGQIDDYRAINFSRWFGYVFDAEGQLILEK